MERYLSTGSLARREINQLVEKREIFSNLEHTTDIIMGKCQFAGFLEHNRQKCNSFSAFTQLVIR